MSIYKDLINAVDKGRKFKVDLINKSLWIDRKLIIEKGERIDDEKEFIQTDDLHCMGWVIDLKESPWETIHFLYDEFKHSAPSKDSNKRSYFKPLSIDELTDDELAFNIDRDFGQALLEGYILLASLKGWLKWNYGKLWFFQSEIDEDLVIIKNWIE